MTAVSRYATPTAFRRALTDRLKTLAGTSRWTLPQLQRHAAYDRLLERLYLCDRDWVVKGAAALMARELGTRGTLDIDLYREISLAAAETDLRRAAADIGDWFRFEVGAATPVGTVGARLPVTSVIGTTTWASFHVDLIGSGLRRTARPEHVPPLAENAIPEVDQHGYQAYPLMDHVADKVAATYERYGTAGMPSTRYRDGKAPDQDHQGSRLAGRRARHGLQADRVSPGPVARRQRAASRRPGPCRRGLRQRQTRRAARRGRPA